MWYITEEFDGCTSEEFVVAVRCEVVVEYDLVDGVVIACIRLFCLRRRGVQWSGRCDEFSGEIFRVGGVLLN